MPCCAFGRPSVTRRRKARRRWSRKCTAPRRLACVVFDQFSLLIRAFGCAVFVGHSVRAARRRVGRERSAERQTRHRRGQCTLLRLLLHARLCLLTRCGCLQASVLYVGGVYKRVEFLACGKPLNEVRCHLRASLCLNSLATAVQAFSCEHAATAGDAIVSADAWKLISKHFKARAATHRYRHPTPSLRFVCRASSSRVTIR